MEFVCIFSALIMAAAFFFLTKEFYNPGTLFLGYWGFITLLSSLNLDNIVPVEQSTYALILLGLLGFGAGALFCCMFRRREYVRKDYSFEIKNYKILYAVCAVIIVYCLYRLGIIISFLAKGETWGSIRLMHGGAGEGGAGTLKGGTISQLMHDFFVGPCVYLLAPAFVIELILGKRNKRFLLLSFVSILLYSVATVSRAVWSFLVLFLLMILLIFAGKKTLSPSVRKWLKWIPLLAAVFVAAILIITSARSEDSQVNLIYNALAYLTGGLKLFDLHLQEPIAEIRTYGFFSTYGFIFPLFFVLNYVGLLKYPSVFADISSIKLQTETFVPISDHVSMNAYTTLFFNFYSDFGLIGIFAGSFIFGALCMMAFRSFTEKKDTRSLICYLILVQFMIFSMARIYSIYTTRALTFVWLFLLLRREKIRPVHLNFGKRKKMLSGT